MVVKVLKFVLTVTLIIMSGMFIFACVPQADKVNDSTQQVESFSASATDVTSSPNETENSQTPELYTEVPPTDTVLETEVILPTPDTSATEEEINTEIAESFFNGKWESSSGMIYIFDGQKGVVVLKEKSTGEVLLEGTYEAYSEDFSEYKLSMTFEGETESFIAWKYSDTGNVKLIIEETGVAYDLLWRSDD